MKVSLGLLKMLEGALQPNLILLSPLRFILLLYAPLKMSCTNNLSYSFVVLLLVNTTYCVPIVNIASLSLCETNR